jgi:uncharacterized membrane protein
MSRRWVEGEGRRWIEQGIITKEQYEKIVALYPYQKSVSERLPIFAAILVGAGILTFIASNWSAIPELIRLLIILIAMSGFYLFGYYKERCSARTLGLSFIVLGIITFGAGIFLTGQMFHFAAHDARAFAIWSLPAIMLTWIYRSRLLYVLTLLILNVGQLYSIISFQQFSWFLAVLLLCGMGSYALQYVQRSIIAVFTVSVLLYGVLYLSAQNQAIGWLVLIAAVLYAAFDWLKDRAARSAGQQVVLFAAFLLTIAFIFFLDEFTREAVPNVPIFLLLFVLAFAASFTGKRRWGKTKALVDWMMFLPLFYVKNIGDVMYLLMMFVFSGYLLWAGYHEERESKVRAGTLLFLISTCVGYIQVAWDFLPKSVFFLVGGLLLFALNWFLQRQRRRLLDDSGKGGDRV